MQEWIEKELATAHFGTVHTRTRARTPRPPAARPRKSKGHVKLRKRFHRVLDAMSQKPSLKFPAGCNGTAEVKAASRFLDNEHVTFTTILAPHQQATLERIRDQPVVLIPQDTTELDLTRPNEVMAGAGPLNDPARVGFFDHISLALTPEHLALGVVDAEVWARAALGLHKEAAQNRAERRARPIEPKESFRWVEGYRAACRVAAAAPGTLVVSLADSEGDIYESLLEARAAPGVGAPRASFIIRAGQDRALVGSEGAPSSDETRHLRERVAGTPVVAERILEIRRRDAPATEDRRRKKARAARTAVVDIRAARVTLRGPDRPGGKLPDLEVNAVLVTERDPPPGVEPVEWLLRTDLPIDAVADVLRVIDYYICRWQIEIYNRVLKSGCKVEESQLETAERFEPYLALCRIVAWRVMHVMMLGRDCPDLPCDIALDEDEWQAVYATVKRQPPPAEPPTMQAMVRLIGSLGGWLGRKGDGEPGPKAMWVGMQRMSDLALGWRARGERPAPPGTDRGGSSRRREEEASGDAADAPAGAGSNPAPGGPLGPQAGRRSPEMVGGGPTSPAARVARRSRCAPGAATSLRESRRVAAGGAKAQGTSTSCAASGRLGAGLPARWQSCEERRGEDLGLPAAGQRGRTTLSDPTIRYEVPETPDIVLRRGELEAVVVDH
jgi:Transposase Tn5 dimerisation domain/Transposase DNA-binding